MSSHMPITADAVTHHWEPKTYPATSALDTILQRKDNAVCLKRLAANFLFLASGIWEATGGIAAHSPHQHRYGTRRERKNSSAASLWLSSYTLQALIDRCPVEGCRTFTFLSVTAKTYAAPWGAYLIQEAYLEDKLVVEHRSQVPVRLCAAQ